MLVTRLLRCLLVFLTLGVVVGTPGPAGAQTTRADSAGVLVAIARDLVVEGREDRARALLALAVERYGDTAPGREAATWLRELRASARETGGETELIAWSTIYGASLGLLVPAALGAEEGEPYGAGLLIGAPLGFLASRAYAASRSMTPGHARAITFGTWWGTWQALGWQEVFDFGVDEEVFCSPQGTDCVVVESDGERAPFAAAVIGGLAGMGIGAALGQNRPITAATALVTNFSALWGTWYGVSAGVIAEAENDALITTALVGGNVGLLVGALAGPRMQMTTGRAWLIHLSGIAGLAAGGGIDLLVEPNDPQLGILIPALTSAIGLAIGFATTTAETGGVDLGGSGSFASHVNGTWRLGVPLPIPTVGRRAAGRASLGLRWELLRATW